MSFNDKNIIITGGNSGIGLAAAHAFKNAGGNVAVCGTNEKTLNDVKSEIGIIAERVNVTNPDEVSAFVNGASDILGKIDVLVCNAGIAEFIPFESAPLAHFKQQMDVNFFGIINTLMAALPHMADNSNIILTTTIANQMAEPGTSGYSASKAAVKTLVNTLSKELSARNIRVNAVSPGPVETPIYAKMGMDKEAEAATFEVMSGKIPAGRMGVVDDISNAILFLASPENNFIVGQELVVDGGITACPTIM